MLVDKKDLQRAHSVVFSSSDQTCKFSERQNFCTAFKHLQNNW